MAATVRGGTHGVPFISVRKQSAGMSLLRENEKGTGSNSGIGKMKTQKKPLLRKDRDWAEYPIGTKAHAYNGGYWIRVETGWKWFCGATFPSPGGDAIGKCIELPD